MRSCPGGCGRSTAPSTTWCRATRSFGAADKLFPRLLDPQYRDDADGDTFAGETNTDYGAGGNVVDADPRIISNLIVDQTSNNPAAWRSRARAGVGPHLGHRPTTSSTTASPSCVSAPGLDGVTGTADDIADFSFPT